MAETATTAPTRTVDQARALYAYEAVSRLKADTSAQPRTKTLIKGLGAMTLQNGLGQALAFLLAGAEGRTSAPERQVYDELARWLCGPHDAAHPERVYPSGELIRQLMAGSRADYQRAQRSTLALCGWLSKFADALLAGEGS